MAIEQKYSPVQRVNIGPGKDTLNDFARKYNLEIEAIYDILNRCSTRKVVFYGTSDYWSAVEGGYMLSLPHNGNVVFAVYRTDSTTESTQILVGVSMDSTNVEIESVEKFDGFMLYAAINNEKGIGYNAEDDIVEMMDQIKNDTEGIRQDVQNELATLHEQLNAFLNEHSDGVMQFDENFDIMPCAFPIGNNLWVVNDDGSLTPIYDELVFNQTEENVDESIGDNEDDSGDDTE